MAAAVLFRGIDQVVRAYQSAEIPAWSLWGGKDQLLFSYSGDDMQEGENLLRQALEMLREGGSTAHLVLKVYSDLPEKKDGKPGKIKSNTPWDNSFGFSLFGWDEESPIGQARTQGYRNLEDRIDKMQQLITNFIEREPEEEEEKPRGFMGMIGGILEKNPQLQEMIVMGIAQKVKGFFNNDKTPVAAMAGIDDQKPQQAGTAWDSLAEDQRQKLQKAMEMLMRVDPQIGDHLLGLANIAVNQPSKYQMALKFL